MKKNDITCIGSAVLDVMFYTNDAVVIKTPQKLTQQQLFGFELGAKIASNEVLFEWGGSALNTAATFRNLGFKPVIVTCVGQDALGKEIISDLQHKKDNVHLIQKHPTLGTAVSFVVNVKKKFDHVIFYYPGAPRGLKITPSLASSIRTPWVYLGSMAGPNWESNLSVLTNHVAKHNLKLAWNPGVEQLAGGYQKLKRHLHQTEVLIVNLDEAVELLVSSGEKIKSIEPRQIIKRLHEFGQSLSIITNGGKGAYVYDGKKLLFKSALKKKVVVNTTGAGDAFGSGFIAGLMMYKGNLSRSLSLAIYNSGKVVSRNGAQKGLLLKADLKKLNI